MPAIVNFEVVGLPAPQGSKTGFSVGGKVRLVEGKGEQRQRHKSWRQAVTEVAKAIADDDDRAPFDCPLGLIVTFRFPMPTSRSKRVQARGVNVKTSAPDLDKLVRSTGDALSASGLIRDDARICQVRAAKVEVVGWTGAEITVYEIEADAL